MRVIVGAAVLAGSTVAGLLFFNSAEPDPRGNQKLTEAPAVAGTETASPEEGDGSAAVDQPGGRYGLSQQELARRKRHEAREKAAETRFRRTIAMDDLNPDDVAADVKELFGTLRLAPVVDPERTEQGHVQGLRLLHLPDEHPLAERGFREGDRLVRINGVALRDPAEIAHLFTRLEGKPEICARRDPGLYCRSIAL